VLAVSFYIMPFTPCICVPSKVSIDASRYRERSSRLGIDVRMWVKTRNEIMHVERREIGAVAVKGLIVKADELLCDCVDVCHS
jgi:hypothetical protein